jgi:hypothetical protein
MNEPTFAYSSNKHLYDWIELNSDSIDKRDLLVKDLDKAQYNTVKSQRKRKMFLDSIDPPTIQLPSVDMNIDVERDEQVALNILRMYDDTPFLN